MACTESSILNLWRCFSLLNLFLSLLKHLSITCLVPLSLVLKCLFWRLYLSVLLNGFINHVVCKLRYTWTGMECRTTAIRSDTIHCIGIKKRTHWLVNLKREAHTTSLHYLRLLIYCWVPFNPVGQIAQRRLGSNPAWCQ